MVNHNDIYLLTDDVQFCYLNRHQQPRAFNKKHLHIYEFMCVAEYKESFVLYHFRGF